MRGFAHSLVAARYAQCWLPLPLQRAPHSSAPNSPASAQPPSPCCPPQQISIGLCKEEDSAEPLILSLHNVDANNNPVAVTNSSSAIKRSEFFVSPSEVGMCDTGGTFLTFDFPVQLPGPPGTKYAVVAYSNSRNAWLYWSSPATTSTLSADYVAYRFSSYNSGTSWSNSNAYNAMWLHFDCAA